VYKYSYDYAIINY